MMPEEIVDAPLAALALGELNCVPALDDASLLKQVDESQRHLFEQTRSGNISRGYRAVRCCTVRIILDFYRSFPPGNGCLVECFDLFWS